jgi:hypothetical protein
MDSGAGAGVFHGFQMDKVIPIIIIIEIIAPITIKLFDGFLSALTAGATPGGEEFIYSLNSEISSSKFL